ncbi:MAG TPA: hypothetical protein VNK24_04810 [Elusimicrobiota bacterium]|nr:hypothetical protein [Elusimicrobiota bacterium]
MKYALPLGEFREAMLDRLLAFLWRQWSALGVLGDSGTEDQWILDPEPLLVFSLELGRYEPRLFDEVLAWLETNGHWLDTARLRQILSAQEGGALRVIGGALRHAQMHGGERKWKNLALFCHNRKPPMGGFLEPLFKEKSGKFYPRAEGDKIDPSFQAFDLNRPRLNIQKKAKEVPVNAHANLRFLMRSLFGVGAKSEALLYLMTHESGHPREIADSVGLFWLSLQQALADLSRSGLVLTKPSGGKKVNYWISQKKWWEFLTPIDYEAGPFPRWLDWIAIFRGLANAWRTVDALVGNPSSEYMAGSKLQDSLEFVALEFARAGLFVSVPGSGLPSDMRQEIALRFLGEIIGLKEGPVVQAGAIHG